MSFADDMNQKSYSQADIDGLKKKYSRIHFTHFKGADLKRQRSRIVRGVRYVWKFGAWRRETK